MSSRSESASSVDGAKPVWRIRDLRGLQGPTITNMFRNIGKHGQVTGVFISRKSAKLSSGPRGQLQSYDSRDQAGQVDRRRDVAWCVTGDDRRVRFLEIESANLARPIEHSTRWNRSR